MIRGLKYLITCLVVNAGALGLVSCTCGSQTIYQDFVNTYVGTSPSITKAANTFGRGTEEYGQTLPAVLEPNGMNFWTAQTRDTEIKCIAPYYYKDTKLQGFRNSHWIVGGCTQDYGSMTLMPVSGALKCQPEERASQFKHENEISTPSYYSVWLDDYQIKAEMTARSRSAIFRFTYPDDDQYLVVNPNSDFGKGGIEIDVEKKQIRGYNPVHRIYQGWGEEAGFKGYFVIEYQGELEEYGVFDGEKTYIGETSIQNKDHIGAYIKFKRTADREVIIKAASSFTGTDGAIKNLEAEISHWNFELTKQELSGIWEKELSAVAVQTSNVTDKRKFYSAMYRASFLPHALNDVDGSYPSFAGGKNIEVLPQGETYYEDYSMWDTYRALHPLINILSPHKAGNMMQSLVHKYEQGGWLPIFPCWNSYTSAMVGDHCVSVLSDAYVKGIRNFNVDKACEAVVKNAFELPESFEEFSTGKGRRALTSYLKYNYIPEEDTVMESFHSYEQVSRTMEYAYDDFAAATLLSSVNKEKFDSISKILYQRSQNYRNVINPHTGYCQGRYADGTFIKSNPFLMASFITEGAPCHYTWYVPHDVYGLMDMMGGKEKYSAKLDSMFTERRYWHGNEPCHQIAYMANYAGEPWKTQQRVRHIMDTEYLDNPGGLSGNDDAGQMSAWYIFSAMGFYPVCPGSPYYIIGSPSFEEVKIRLENGKTFVIRANGAGSRNIYVQSVRLNGKSYDKNYFSHRDIIEGGIMEFEMGPEPNRVWGSGKDALPVDLMSDSCKNIGKIQNKKF